MKKIALIMDGWKRWFTFAWPAGILQRIRQTGEEVSLYIFNSSGDGAAMRSIIPVNIIYTGFQICMSLTESFLISITLATRRCGKM